MKCKILFFLLIICLNNWVLPVNREGADGLPSGGSNLTLASASALSKAPVPAPIPSLKPDLPGWPATPKEQTHISGELSIPAIDGALNNPFTGWCPWTADSSDKYSSYQPHSLVFSPIDWTVFEPREGVYDVEARKASMYYDVWADANVKFVIRPVLDYPNGTISDPGMDIPRWLYDKMTDEEGAAGFLYDNRYGIGFSPDYFSKVLQEAHGRMIAKLGEVFDGDPNIAFVQLGSIGHWGEWHTNYGEGVPRIPRSSVTDIYVQHYIDAFRYKKLMINRPYAIARDNGFGLYDDSFLIDNAKWLGRVAKDYIYPATNELLPAMPDFWKFGPSGGELGQGTKPLAISNPLGCVYWIKQSHTTFLGPHSLTSDLKTREEFGAANIIRRAMGYRLRVGSVRLEEKETGRVALITNWENDGVAPFYYPWPVVIELVNEDGRVIYRETTDWDIRSIMPKERTVFTAEVDASLCKDGTVTVKVSVYDPDRNVPGVYLAQQFEDGEGGYELCVVKNGVVSLPSGSGAAVKDKNLPPGA